MNESVIFNELVAQVRMILAMDIRPPYSKNPDNLSVTTGSMQII